MGIWAHGLARRMDSGLWDGYRMGSGSLELRGATGVSGMGRFIWSSHFFPLVPCHVFSLLFLSHNRHSKRAGRDREPVSLSSDPVDSPNPTTAPLISYILSPSPYDYFPPVLQQGKNIAKSIFVLQSIFGVFF